MAQRSESLIVRSSDFPTIGLSDLGSFYFQNFVIFTGNKNKLPYQRNSHLKFYKNPSMPHKITRHEDLIVYQDSFDLAMEIFQLSKHFPKEERYSLTDQIRRSSRSVSANLAEAWRKRRYQAAFIAKLTDVEAEAAETRVWLNFSRECEYLDPSGAHSLLNKYDRLLGRIVHMGRNADKWTL